MQPTNPFTWASGWKSPIYCDNRKTLSYPELRTWLKEQFSKLIREKHPDVEVIAGVATGAIAQGALVAEELGLPFVYVRSAPKGHGLTDLMEGAAFTEQEKREYLGIVVDGLPETKHRFFLPQDFPKDIYPLRKDEKKIPDSMIKNMWACGRPKNRQPAPLEDE